MSHHTIRIDKTVAAEVRLEYLAPVRAANVHIHVRKLTVRTISLFIQRVRAVLTTHHIIFLAPVSAHIAEIISRKTEFFQYIFSQTVFFQNTFCFLLRLYLFFAKTLFFFKNKQSRCREAHRNIFTLYYKIRKSTHTNIVLR